MTLALLAEGQEDLTQVLLASLGVFQTICLAVIADRSRQRRREDDSRRRGRRRRPSDEP